MAVELVMSWHGVLLESDQMASDSASVDFVAMLARFLEPKVVVEAGTYRGHLTFAVANILRHTSKGMIYTADPTDYVTFALAEIVDLRPYIHYHHGDFLDMLSRVPGEIDLAYIDASHPDLPHLRWEHASAVMLRLRPGGVMVIDDTASSGWADAERFRNWGAHSIHLGNFRGLTLIQKRLD